MGERFVFVRQAVNEMYGDGLSVGLDDLPLHGGQYHMTEFVKKYFREAQRNRRSDTRMLCDITDTTPAHTHSS